MTDAIDTLCREYNVWNSANNLRLGSADEHHNDPRLTEEQRAWVRDFSRRWDEAVEAGRSITFAQFQASRTECADLRTPLLDELGSDVPVPGFLYLGSLYIESTSTWTEEYRDQGKWSLLIERSQYVSDDLERLERKLYQYATESGHIEKVK